ncbi:MAG: hypothetical protein RIQ79_1481 [Verrucomicrobiota bacterium]|jgi:hypothetical protein
MLAGPLDMETRAGVGGIAAGSECVAVEGVIDRAIGEMMIRPSPSGKGPGMASAAGLGCLGGGCG